MIPKGWTLKINFYLKLHAMWYRLQRICWFGSYIFKNILARFKYDVISKYSTRYIIKVKLVACFFSLVATVHYLLDVLHLIYLRVLWSVSAPLSRFWLIQLDTHSIALAQCWCTPSSRSFPLSLSLPLPLSFSLHLSRGNPLMNQYQVFPSSY